MKLSDFFDKDAFFRSEDEIKSYISNSKNYKGENPSEATLFNFFNTSKQRTYLVVTDKMIYCILDDSRKNKPHINWSARKSEFFDGQNIKLTLPTRDKTPNTGLVDFGPSHKNWLFSKSLFKNTSIEEKFKVIVSDDFSDIEPLR